MEKTVIPPVHPGRLLRKDFLMPMGITPSALAKAIHVPKQKIVEIIDGRRRVSAEVALRLSRYLGMSGSFWMNLQSHYDLEVARDRLGERLEREVAQRIRPKGKEIAVAV